MVEEVENVVSKYDDITAKTNFPYEAQLFKSVIDALILESAKLKTRVE